MKKIIVFVLLLNVMVFSACTANDASVNMQSQPPAQVDGNEKPVYRKISAGEAYQMMRNTSEYILLDVRSLEEFTEKHISGAALIPDNEIVNRAAKELPDKNALILVYCRSGARSAKAANELVGMGYANVYDFGGIIDWPYE